MRIVTALLALLLVAPAALADDATAYKVIVNPQNPADAIGKEQLSQMFLKKLSKWPNGQAVAPAEPAEGSPAREAFCRDVHGKSASALKSYWSRLVFAGREVP